MVQADENTIQALINTVKRLPVDCKNFDIADSWVGIVIELEKIAGNTVNETEQEAIESPVPERVEVRYAPPENILKDSEEITDG